MQLDALAHAAGVRAYAVHPGQIATNLARHLDRQEMQATADNDAIKDYKTPEQGAATTTWAAIGGVYCEDCDIAELAAGGRAATGVRAYAIDPAEAPRLWTLSAGLANVDAFA